MPKICIDPGHNSSGADTGAKGNGLFEKDLTLDIARRLRTILELNMFEIIMTRDSDFVNGPHKDTNESLKTRCDIANASGADLFVSIHINAGGGTGTEVYALPGGRAVVAAQRVLERLIYACGWASRGIKTDREFFVLVHTEMPAILTENGFIDSQDAQKLADTNFRQGIAIAHAKGICDYFGIGYKESITSASKTLILGAETVRVEQCQLYIANQNPNAPDIIPFYKKYGEQLGIRWGYAVAQAIIETGFFKFGGDVKPEQNNFASIGAVGDGAQGAFFSTPEQGVLAHLEHLFAYASSEILPSGLPKVDPRFDLVTRSSCPNWEDLNGHWAVPGIGYGEEIVRIHDDISQINIAEESSSIYKYLVLYFGDADLQIAADLAQHFKCPIIQACFALPELLALFEIKYQVGGATAPDGVILLAGDHPESSDRFDAMKSVLKVIGKI